VPLADVITCHQRAFREFAKCSQAQRVGEICKVKLSASESQGPLGARWCRTAFAPIGRGTKRPIQDAVSKGDASVQADCARRRPTRSRPRSTSGRPTPRRRRESRLRYRGSVPSPTRELIDAGHRCSPACPPSSPLLPEELAVGSAGRRSRRIATRPRSLDTDRFSLLAMA